MITIELRLTEVDPPTAEPERTIYRDIVNLPDPTTLGITIRYFNYDNVGLYMQITGSATGYTFTPVNLGLLASGANAYKNLDNFASRAKPTVAQLPNGEMSENITLTLKGYTDAGYTTLKWTYNRIVTVIWINSADASFTVDVLNDFDDGTVQGWAVANELNNLAGYPTIAVVNDYVLSVPYSCKMTQCQHLSRTAYQKMLQIDTDGDAKIRLGRWSTDEPYEVPVNKWIRLVIPLNANTTLEIRIRDTFNSYYGVGYNTEARARLYKSFTTPNKTTVYAIMDLRLGQSGNSALMWLDDFKIISK